MIMQNLAAGPRRFFKKEEGMVTVEWLALAAAVTIGAVGVSWTLYNGLKPGPSATIATNIDGVAAKTTTVAAP
jgi:Flp pilus assembly pilin Flp